MSIQRYTFGAVISLNEDGYTRLEPKPRLDGEYVLHSDHAALAAKGVEGE